MIHESEMGKGWTGRRLEKKGADGSLACMLLMVTKACTKNNIAAEIRGLDALICFELFRPEKGRRQRPPFCFKFKDMNKDYTMVAGFKNSIKWCRHRVAKSLQCTLNGFYSQYRSGLQKLFTWRNKKSRIGFYVTDHSQELFRLKNITSKW